MEGSSITSTSTRLTPWTYIGKLFCIEHVGRSVGILADDFTVHAVILRARAGRCRHSGGVPQHGHRSCRFDADIESLAKVRDILVECVLKLIETRHDCRWSRKKPVSSLM